MRILAIADDTTGALEVGGQFALRGLKALVTTKESFELSGDAVIMDTQTRHLPADVAKETVSRLASAARRAGIPHLYKKTDSTLRGNIASEFRALLDEFPERPLIYVPAYPKMGRIVRKGELLVDGKPLAETAIARDPLNPVHNGSIPAMLSGVCPVSVAETTGSLGRLLAAATGRSVFVCDGSSDQDLAEAAAVIGSLERPCLVAGTGGFVGHWASSLPVKPGYAAPAMKAKRCLIVSGSLHPASLEQVSRAASAGLPTFYLSEQAEQDEGTVQQLLTQLDAGRWPVVATPGTCKSSVGQRIGTIVRRVLGAEPVDCLVIFGGDTTLAVLNALGIHVLESGGELASGIPLSIGSYRGRPLMLVTKAGGFGTAETMIMAKNDLEKRQ